ncbi:MAG: MBL fold metallo-hydrolase [Cyclobacteriaceae bacterium]
MRSFLLISCILILSFTNAQPYILVLGTAQDAGFPHIGCKNECQLAFEKPELKRFVVSLALVDPEAKKWWMFEATPDMDDQLQYFHEQTNWEYEYLPEGIFLTHAHIGHYVGLMTLGREAVNASNVKVYSLPKMKEYLKTNGPWSQLVNLNNINLIDCEADRKIELTKSLHVTPFAVPHRDEFSETAGFRIKSAKRSYLFIPDINKWELWNRSVVEEVKKVDYAFLDASFFQDGEIPGRSIADIPHPFVVETMQLFSKESDGVKSKVHMIHFNHTNPILFDGKKRQEVIENGFNLAEQGDRY